jgi:hypothetical protein
MALLVLVGHVYSKTIKHQNSNDFNNPSDNQIKLLKKIFSQKSNSRLLSNEIEDDLEYQNSPLDDYNVDDEENEQINEHKRKYDTSYETYFNLKKNNKANKRSFQIQTYYDAVVQKDGSILLIPKDVNKNHYFIG